MLPTRMTPLSSIARGIGSAEIVRLIRLTYRANYTIQKIADKAYCGVLICRLMSIPTWLFLTCLFLKYQQATLLGPSACAGPRGLPEA